MRSVFSAVFQFCFVGLLMIVAKPQAARGDDWPQWGGPNHDLVWREKGIVDKLPTSGELPRVWSTPIGEGYTGPAVANGRVYVTDFMREGGNRGTERVLCLDAESGKILWKHEYPCQYTVSYPFGPRATPVVDASRVYTIGAQGHMFCFETETGKILWQKNFVDDYKTDLPTWGMAASPLVEGDQLITLVGGEKALVVSFDKATGKELWRALDDQKVGYCPPMIFMFGKTRQLIIWHPEAITSLDPANGKEYWSVPWRIHQSALCIPTPRQVGNRLFITTFYSGPIMLEVTPDEQPTAKIVWKGKSNSEIDTDGLHAIMCTPWVTETHIYGVCSHGQLRCLEADTGKRVWETLAATGTARWWNAFIIPHEDRFFIHNEQGDLIIAKLTPGGYEELSRAKLVEPTRPVQRRMTIWSHPAFAMKSVFARNDKEIVRVNLAK